MGSNHASQLLATAINPCRMPPARYITQPHRRCPFSQHAVVGSRCCYLHPSHSPCSTKMPPRSLTSGGCTLVVAAPCPSTRSPSVSPLAQQPRRLRALSARCFVKPVDSTPSTLAGCLLFLRSPIRDVVETRGPRDDDRDSDVVPPTRCSRWTTQERMDITSGCSPSEYLPQQTLSKC
ncbi:uncharacterized protein [Zea mays]|uniref:Uncharacterized protein n=1 Tax=Zea mays TaxID=4577 RepID=B4FLM5_MAIZE|nr:uncharacterized protein LOC100857071 [Zea mays]XP_008651824.1 uncharacterized protein LOC100857071 isoform X1 [Zea mays]ACF83018.1 unknown [Zea mays]|eukprot:NP_001241854.1 uncharacterized protein LOC100857071 [Zea mays]